MNPWHAVARVPEHCELHCRCPFLRCPFLASKIFLRASRTMVRHACHCVPAGAPMGEQIGAALPRLR
jgi:hypothetical protein